MGTSTASARVSAFASAYAPLLVSVILVYLQTFVGMAVLQVLSHNHTTTQTSINVAINS